MPLTKWPLFHPSTRPQTKNKGRLLHHPCSNWTKPRKGLWPLCPWTSARPNLHPKTKTIKQKPSSSWLRTVRTCRSSKCTNLQRWETNMGLEDDETVEETPSPPPHPSGAPLTHQISTVDSFPTRTKIKISKLEYLYIYTFIYRETEVVGVSAMQGNLDRRRRNRVYQRLF